MYVTIVMICLYIRCVCHVPGLMLATAKQYVNQLKNHLHVMY